MTMNQPRLRKLRYQITPEDYAALRACLSARAEERETRSVHTMFFTSYRDHVPAGSMGEILAPEREEARFSLHYYDNDPTYLILERRQDGQRTSAMVAEAECAAGGGDGLAAGPAQSAAAGLSREPDGAHVAAAGAADIPS